MWDRRQLSFYFSLGGLLISGAMAQEEPTSRPMISEPAAPRARIPDKGQLAAAVALAYRKAEFLSFDLDVQAPPSRRVRCQVKMAPGKLRNTIYLEDQPTTVLLISGGRVREHRLHYHGINDLVLEYDAPVPGGTHDALIGDDILEHGCLFGTCLQSWIGPGSARSARLSRWITEGDLVADESVDGRSCSVVKFELAYGYHLLYFDQETFFLRRWDTYDSDKGPTPVLNRTRRYKDISTEPIPLETWRWDVSPSETRRHLKARESSRREETSADSPES